MPWNPTWPVLTRYRGEHLRCVALPLGGLGTGTVSLGGRGDLRDWEVVNRPAKGFTPGQAFFALWARPVGGAAVTRALEGMLQPPYEGGFGAGTPNHGLPRFRECEFAAAYPLAQLALADPDVPLRVRLEAFNPLVPGDSEASGLPVAILRYVLTNPGDVAVDAAIAGTVPNFIGHDGSAGAAKQNRNEWLAEKSVRGLRLSSDGVAPAAEQWGTMALATTARAGVTHRTAWARLNWGDSLLDFWDDFSADGRLDERAVDGVDDPRASLAVRLRIPPGEQRTVVFVLAWHFPNRTTWTALPDTPPEVIGNYYTTRWPDAWAVAADVAARLPRLEQRTVAFVTALCDSDLPAVVKEAALYNLPALRSQTSFRTPDGRFYGWEGCGDRQGCCHGSCTHVWNYEQATAFLFGDLARTMREVEFAFCTSDRGHMSFRVDLPLQRATRFGLAAADGQMGCLLKLYRDWQLSGDRAFLEALWPHAKRAVEFCWVSGGWDADQDGVMEGCQHNTMDVEYYGPNPQMTGWYLGALRAAEEMARAVGDRAFAKRCRDLSRRGRKWVDRHLFNGEYYEHRIVPPADPLAIAPGLRHDSMGARNLTEPELQLGAGCLVDQLVGQFVAHVCGLGHLLDPAHVGATLASIRRYNFKDSLHAHFNHLRSFALADESALLMATYPKGRRPKRPFPYYNEVMTGFEYTAAVHMLYEGQLDEGLRCMQAIRDRYDGRRRSPFDEAECGHHYARAMASWAAILALTGFQWSGVTRTMTFAAADQPVTWFWSNGSAWGTLRQEPTADGLTVTLSVSEGSVRLRRLVLTGAGELTWPRAVTVRAGREVTGQVARG